MMTIQQYCRKELEVIVNDKLNSSPQCHPVAKKLTFRGCMNTNVTCRTCEEILLPLLQHWLGLSLAHDVSRGEWISWRGFRKEQKKSLEIQFMRKRLITDISFEITSVCNKYLAK